MDHYRLWRQDLDLAADLGVSSIRYGIPWYRVNPQPGGVRLVVDRRGARVPRRGQGADADHRPDALRDAALAGQPVRQRRPIRAGSPSMPPGSPSATRRWSGIYTPLNEPAVTAAYCGRDGRWPPYLSRRRRLRRRSCSSLARGSAGPPRPSGRPGPTRSSSTSRTSAWRRPASPTWSGAPPRPRAAGSCPSTCVCGRVVPGHPGFDWLVEHGATEAELLRSGRGGAAVGRARRELLSLDQPPARPRRERPDPLGGRFPARALAEVLRLVHDRYGLPVMVTETSATGTQLERSRWLEGTLGAVRQVRRQGVPVVGYTWFPLFTMIEWKYRWSRKAARGPPPAPRPLRGASRAAAGWTASRPSWSIPIAGSSPTRPRPSASSPRRWSPRPAGSPRPARSGPRRHRVCDRPLGRIISPAARSRGEGQRSGETDDDPLEVHTPSRPRRGRDRRAPRDRLQQ